MDTSSIILGSILSILCLSPFLMEINRLRKRNKTIQLLIKNLDGADKARFKQLSQLKSIILGWDPNLGKLFFFRKNEHDQPLWLDLKSFQDVSLELKRTGPGVKAPITEIVLELKGINHKEHLYLYRSSTDDSLGGEYQLAKLWYERLHKFLQTK